MKEIFVLLRHISNIVGKNLSWQETATVIRYILCVAVNNRRFSCSLRVQKDKLIVANKTTASKSDGKEVSLTAREAALLVGSANLYDALSPQIQNIIEDLKKYEKPRDDAPNYEESGKQAGKALKIRMNLAETTQFTGTLPQCILSPDIDEALLILSSIRPESALSTFLNEQFVLHEVFFTKMWRSALR